MHTGTSRKSRNAARHRTHLMDSAADSLFASLTTYQAVQDLIDSGEVEGQILERKAPQGPRIGRDLRAKLAGAASGFANTGGGVILWGVSTVRHASSELDVLTQIEPIGNVRKFAQQIDQSLAASTVPRLRLTPTRVLTERSGDTKGIGVTLISETPGDPVQSSADQLFHIRTGAEFNVMPYEIIQRMFAGAAGPILRPVFVAGIVNRREPGIWEIPIIVENQSSAAAKDATISVEILNATACSSVTTTGLQDVSNINPGRSMFTVTPQGPIFRGLNIVVGALFVEMKKGKKPKRVLTLQIILLADRMRGTQLSFRLQLAQSGFSVKQTSEGASCTRSET